MYFPLTSHIMIHLFRRSDSTRYGTRLARLQRLASHHQPSACFYPRAQALFKAQFHHHYHLPRAVVTSTLVSSIIKTLPYGSAKPRGETKLAVNFLCGCLLPKLPAIAPNGNTGVLSRDDARQRDTTFALGKAKRAEQRSPAVCIDGVRVWQKEQGADKTFLAEQARRRLQVKRRTHPPAAPLPWTHVAVLSTSSSSPLPSCLSMLRGK